MLNLESSDSEEDQIMESAEEEEEQNQPIGKGQKSSFINLFDADDDNSNKENSVGNQISRNEAYQTIQRELYVNTRPKKTEPEPPTPMTA
jgi:hypothetical protein